jgi:hypothetical protein
MQKFTVLSAQTGPLEGGGTYASLWVSPLPGDYADRSAPHLTLGPVPMKIDTTPETISSVIQQSKTLPAVFSLEMGIRVSGGNKSKAFINSAKLEKI